MKHLKRLMPVIYSYLEIYDGPHELCRLSVLDALKAVLEVAWPRLSAHSDSILKALVRLMFDISVDQTLTPEDVKSKVIQRCVDNCVLLKRLNSEEVCAKISALVDPNPTCAAAFALVLKTE
jgi:hypothetical protein